MRRFPSACPFARFLTCVLLTLLHLGGCGKGGGTEGRTRSDIQRAALTEFAHLSAAVSAGDVKAFREHLSERSRQMLRGTENSPAPARIQTFMSLLQAEMPLKVTSADVHDGNTVRLAVHGAATDFDLVMIREEAGWKLDITSEIGDWRALQEQIHDLLKGMERKTPFL